MANETNSGQKEWAHLTRLEAFRKWRRQGIALARGVSDALIEAAQMRPAMKILDLASGAGEPALALCQTVGPEGQVIATDVAPELLALAEEFAQEQGVKNIILTQARAESLPFVDEKFDRVTCRFGVMYFANPLQGLREAYRVLRPGGRTVFAVWTSPEQPFFASTVGVLEKYVRAPSRQAKQPDPFRFAALGSLSALMRDAGFQPVQEETRKIALTWPGSPEQFWEYFQEHTAPFRTLIDGLAQELRPQVASEVYRAAEKYFDGRQISFPAVILLVSGLR